MEEVREEKRRNERERYASGTKSLETERQTNTYPLREMINLERED